MNRLPDVIEVHAFNVSLYPDSSDAHFALGTAYRRRGDIARAVASFRRAVELDPKNARASQWLEKLQAPKQ